jgi:hypothetical protein
MVPEKSILRLGESHSLPVAAVALICTYLQIAM